jgi:hypothetical protein
VRSSPSRGPPRSRGLAAGAYDEEFGICIAQNSSSNGGTGCDNADYTGCDEVYCNDEVVTAGGEACSSVCGQ